LPNFLNSIEPTTLNPVNSIKFYLLIFYFIKLFKLIDEKLN